MFAALKTAADAAPGPGKVMLQLEKKGEYAVILEPEGMNVAADPRLGRARGGARGQGISARGGVAGAKCL